MEKCTLKCPACFTGTSGIFNSAYDILDKIKAQKALKEERKRARKEVANGEDRHLIYQTGLE